MKRLVIVRHGTYGDDMHLDQNGREQIRRLAGKLQGLDGGLGSAVILTSTAPRALDSAYIIGATLGLVPQEREVLWSGDNFSAKEQWDLKKILALIKENERSDTVILVAHLETAEDLPGRFARDVLGVYFRGDGLDKGAALVVDCQAKAFSYSTP